MAKGLSRYLKPEVVSGLKGIDLKARLIVEGFIAGLHKSPYRGRSVEFADFRTYNPGDDLGSIDWKVYARTDRYYIKEYEERTNLRAYLLIDISNSMSFGLRITKFDYAACLAASMVYLLIKQRDSVGIGLFAETLEAIIPPSGGDYQLKLILDLLDRTRPEKKTSVAGAIGEIAARIKRRGMVIIFSDLFDDPEETMRSIALLRTMKNEVIVFMILDPEEKKFTFKTPGRFHDLETRKELLIDPKIVRQDYQKRIETFIRRYRDGFLNHDVDFHLVTTDTGFDRGLLHFLEKRRRVWIF